MDSLGTRLKAARERAGLTQAELALRVGIKQPSVQAIESGKAGGTKHMTTIARVLGVEASWLAEGTGIPPIKHPPNRALTADGLVNDSNVRFRTLLSPSDPRDIIDVLGATAGGSDGSFFFNGEVVDRIARPPFLAGAQSGYGLYVEGESMSPRYHPGEIVYVHPGKPVTVGSYVVVQLKPKIEGDTPLAFLKRLVRRTAKTVFLEQYNPKRIIEFPTADVISMHKVVGGGDS